MNKHTLWIWLIVGALASGGIIADARAADAPQRKKAGNVATAGNDSTISPGFSKMITDPEAVFEVPTVAKPGYLTPVVAPPPFPTRITRISGDPGTAFHTAGGRGKWGADARHHYSRDQAWNSDNTLIALQNSGSPKQLFLDGETYQVRYGSCPNYRRGDDRWHPSLEHPYERVNAKDTRLTWFDVVHCTRTRFWSLPFPVRNLGASKGNPSADGRFVVLHDTTRMFVVDMDPQPPFAPYPSSRIGPPAETSDCGLAEGCRMSWASISPSGQYAVVHYKGDHERVYDVNPATLAMTPRPMPKAYTGCPGDPGKGFIYDLGHADLAQNPFDDNEDVIIGQEHCGNRGKTVDGRLLGGVIMVRLRDGMITPLTDPRGEAYPHHVSAQNTQRPGWVYVSYFPGEDGKRFNDEIVAVKMDGSQSVERFCQKRSVTKGCYRCESHGLPSRDGMRVLFASNWYEPSGSIQAYVVDARAADGFDPSEPARKPPKMTHVKNTPPASSLALLP